MPSSTKLAVFDAVTSNTALTMPVERLVELCRSRRGGKEVEKRRRGDEEGSEHGPRYPIQVVKPQSNL